MLQFRNINATPDDHVTRWGVEGLLTAIERGDATHWDRIIAWAARGDEDFRDELDEALDAAEGGGKTWIRHKLERIDETPQQQMQRRIITAWRTSGLTQAQFAQELGTSASRMSTYINGSTTPSAERFIAMEMIAEKYRLRRLPA